MANIENQLWAESIVSGRSFEPLVNIRLNETNIGQFDPNAARQFAGQVFEAAEAAESDAFVFHWLYRDIIGTDADNKENFDKLMNEFREFRDSRRKEKP